jgi:hypothetical protein
MNHIIAICVCVFLALSWPGLSQAEAPKGWIPDNKLPAGVSDSGPSDLALPLVCDNLTLTSYGRWDDSCDNEIDCCSPVHDDRSLRFRLTEFNIYPTFSYRGSQSATYNEFEFASHTDWGGWKMENRTVLNVADLPPTIKLGPTNPPFPDGSVGRASGFGDILSGFFFSPESESKTHLGIGPVFTFASATDPGLGSEQYTVGPGAHFSTERGRLTAGFFLWQSWKFAGSDSQKRVNQLFGKPFFLYELNQRWNLIYIPLGLSHSWEAKSGEDWTVPLGGGLRRLFYLGDQKMGFQTQVFDYVARKPADPEWEVRMTIEFLFGE